MLNGRTRKRGRAGLGHVNDRPREILKVAEVEADRAATQLAVREAARQAARGPL